MSVVVRRWRFGQAAITRSRKRTTSSTNSSPWEARYLTQKWNPTCWKWLPPWLFLMITTKSLVNEFNFSSFFSARFPFPVFHWMWCARHAAKWMLCPRIMGEDGSLMRRWFSSSLAIYSERTDLSWLPACEIIYAWLSSHWFQGTEIIAEVVGNMPDDIFLALADYASVGFFTVEEGTTVFPEYEHLQDRPECEGKIRPFMVFFQSG